MRQIKEDIEKQLEESLPKFMDTGYKIPWQERSILMSEAFAFCGVGDLFDIDIVLESGIWLGRSTEIFASYFAPKPIIAIDVTLKKTMVDRLKKYENLTLIKGDGPAQIKTILRFPQVKRAGIFIDGPKEHKAVECVQQFLPYVNVSFVAIHDTHKPKLKRMLINLNCPLFFTCEKWFLEKYRKLDENESQWDEQQGMKWTPRWIISRKGKEFNRDLGIYGPTVGFAFKEGTQ